MLVEQALEMWKKRKLKADNISVMIGFFLIDVDQGIEKQKLCPSYN